MGKPRMILIVRHAQSEGNRNKAIHQTVPDHRVKLTEEGHAQALDAGLRLRKLLRPDDTLQIFTSPYRRTRDTAEGILKSLDSEHPELQRFPRDQIKVYEEPRLREQDFGNFQPCSAEMERMWQERADYGHFFYRIPSGESAADAYDRISGFNESLWRQFNDKDFPSVCVLVTHGLMTRVFLMKWYHWTVERFEDLRNINHCEFVIMEQEPESGKYDLKTELRTWSALKRERSLAASSTAEPTASAEKSSKDLKIHWGGCLGGCNHGTNPMTLFREALVAEEAHIASGSAGYSSSSGRPTKSLKRIRSIVRHLLDDEDSDDPRGKESNGEGKADDKKATSTDHAHAPLVKRNKSSNLDIPKLYNRLIDVNRKARISGRDGGGSRSGLGTEAEDSSADDDPTSDESTNHDDLAIKKPSAPETKKEAEVPDEFIEKYGLGQHSRANTLGDLDDEAPEKDREDEEDASRSELEKREDSVLDSVY